ncbi:MarR family transcriptional regulator [Macrococcus hajekii]|uniref:MarR family transcriptional regulator n=1 Tax=Macrococcus hajekii TaxID=198482 RepID=A0A4R6BJB7_9STAP|nr:helix-turn-helix domain-containing protein [Macrococcus hajekii]TDM01710.1 MarR family transcriptional regulator [Macrococcus hajekii]GGB06754.1 MarR family transcriptional regulator [Macrococcus hajekii]
MKSNDDDLMLFYFGYQTFIKTADDIISQYGMNRQHHRFLFFISKLPDITVKELLQLMEISKQGSHETLKTLKAQNLIEERPAEHDRRMKQLHATHEGEALIQKLNQAQIELFQTVFESAGTDWHEVIEAFASKRPGYEIISQFKNKKKSD